MHKLQKHKMTHTGEKAHKCYQCLPCVHAPSFKIQMRTHMGEMSYKCSQYNYTCTRVTNLHTSDTLQSVVSGSVVIVTRPTSRQLVDTVRRRMRCCARREMGSLPGGRFVWRRSSSATTFYSVQTEKMKICVNSSTREKESSEGTSASSAEAPSSTSPRRKTRQENSSR